MSDAHESRWSEELAAYALGALEPGEAAELEAHLKECKRCRAELLWFEPVVAALPEAGERHEAPKRVRDRVMAEVRADARRSRDAENATAGRRAPGWLGRLRSGAYGWKPAVALATMALAVVAVLGYAVGSEDGSDPAPVVRSGEAPGVVAEMTREGEGGRLALANVKQLPEDRVLEAWVERDGEVEAVPALFVPDQEGRASTAIEDMDGVETVMVTHEPRGGSDSPTSDPIVVMPIPQ
jgi:anti-sigma-K factor RskA